MKYLLLYIITFSALCSCSSVKKKYNFTSVSFFEDKKTELYNYIDESEKNLALYTVFPEITKDNYPLLWNSLDLQNQKKINEIKTLLLSVNEQKQKSVDYKLSLVVLLISELKYQKALEALDEIENDKFNPIIELLIIDMEYELNKNKEGYLSRNTISDYQDLFDKYSDNKLLEEMIKSRIRNLRYKI